MDAVLIDRPGSSQGIFRRKINGHGEPGKASFHQQEQSVSGRLAQA